MARIRIRHRLASAAGLSLVELAAGLTVAAIVTSLTVPAVQDYVAQARLQRAFHDTHAIAAAVARFESDVLGQHATLHAWTSLDLLVGTGAVPAAGAGGDTAWLAPSGSEKVGSLDDQLVTNAPGYTTSPPRQSTGIRGWHGPYLEGRIGPDPWGNRYAINIRALANGASCSVVVSAGPNGTIETSFEGSVILAGGDDVVALIAPPR